MATTPTLPGQPGPMQPSDYTPAAQSQVVSWNLKRVAPPSPLYVRVDDVLRVAAASSQFGEVVTVNYRLLRAMDGVVVDGQFTVAPPNTRAVMLQDQPLAEGFLLSVSCKAAAATTRGQTFVRLFLNPKSLGQGQPGYMMMADYVTTAMAPGFPNGRSIAPSEGPGAVVLLGPAQPGAGLDWTVTTPANARWRLVGGRAVLAADVVVANRVPYLVLQAAPGGLSIAWQVAASSSPITAGANAGISFGAVNVPVVAGSGIGHWQVPPDFRMLSGWSVASLTSGLDSGDQWSLIRIEVEEWLDNV